MAKAVARKLQAWYQAVPSVHHAGITLAPKLVAPGIVMSHQRSVKLIRSEFLEVPGLQLTLDQAQRFWGIDRVACRQVFDSLVETGFLCVRPNGMYRRLTEGIDQLRPQPGKARLKIDNSDRRS